MKKRYFGLVIASVVALALIPVILQGRVKDTPHKLTGSNGIVVANDEVCRPCHAPHNTDVATGYLWNHQMTTATYTLHDDADSLVSKTSRMCLSCHDGTVALDSFGGVTGTNFIDGDDLIGTDLRGHHPIAVTYPAADTFHFNTPDADGNIADPVETPAGMSAHLEDGEVQCVSCHFAHGSRAAYGMFLRVDNTGSALCMSCHKTPG